MKKIFGTLVACLISTAAFGQAQLGPGNVWGNTTAAKAPPQDSTVTAILDRALGSTRGSLIERGASGWTILAPSATARVPYLSGGTGADPLFGAYTLPASVTSGGVACFTSTTAQGSSSLLTANALVLGGGAGVCPSPLGSLGTTTTVLHGNAGGAPAFSAITGADLPVPGASSLGGVFSATAGANQFQTGINTSGAPTFAQPAFSNLSGSATCAQLPALTGNVTSSACATTIAALPNATISGTPTFSGLQTYGGGQAVIGSPAFAGIWHWGGDIAANLSFTTSGGATQGSINTASNTLPEIIMNLGFTSSNGSANPTTAYKIAFSAWTIATSASADIYSMNPVCQGNASFVGRLVCQENDINDNTGQTHEFASIGTGSASYTYKAISGGSGNVSAAMWVFNGGAGKFANGIAITGALSATDSGNAAFQAIAGGYNFARGLGSWVNGINLFGSTITGGLGTAFLSPNNVGLGSANQAGAAVVPLIYLDNTTTPNENIVIGNGPHPIVMNGAFQSTGPAPNLSGCGTSPSIDATSNNNRGNFTVGNPGTTCTVTFSTSNKFVNTPQCSLSIANGGIAGPTYSTSLTAITITVTTAGSKYQYVCI